MAKTIYYFISGHMNLSQEDFNKYYVPEIEKVINGDQEFVFIMGDCKGVDYMAQKYLVDKGYSAFIELYHMFDKPRHLLDKEIICHGGYTSDIERDAAMTRASDIDIAFIQEGRWTSGTAQNILRRHEIKKRD